MFYSTDMNKVTKMLRQAGAQYWKNKFRESKDSKSFWKTVNEATGKCKSTCIGLLKDANNHEITNDNEKGELINSYFINIGSELAAKFSDAEDLCQFVCRVTPTTQSLDVNINKLTNDLRIGIKICDESTFWNLLDKNIALQVMMLSQFPEHSRLHKDC